LTLSSAGRCASCGEAGIWTCPVGPDEGDRLLRAGPHLDRVSGALSGATWFPSDWSAKGRVLTRLDVHPVQAPPMMSVERLTGDAHRARHRRHSSAGSRPAHREVLVRLAMTFRTCTTPSPTAATIRRMPPTMRSAGSAALHVRLSRRDASNLAPARRPPRPPAGGRRVSGALSPPEVRTRPESTGALARVRSWVTAVLPSALALSGPVPTCQR